MTRQVQRTSAPLLVRLFRIPAFSASLVVNVLAIFVAVGYFLFVAQYLQLLLGLSPLEAGLWSVPSAIGFIVGSNLAPRIVRRVRPPYLMGAWRCLAVVMLRNVGRHEAAANADDAEPRATDRELELEPPIAAGAALGEA